MEGYGSRPLLVGGGSGLSPLVGLCRRLREAGVKPAVLLGFRDRRSRLGAEFFPGAELRYTEDVFPEMEIIPHDAVYACGSQAMMLELCRRETGPAQVAFDVRMGCGFGACMGCSLKTPSGMKRVCRDGPVFRKEELV
jgi:dihydroorotate dehydrogenase electron transfer subunit